MGIDQSLWGFIADAGLVVKVVMGILLLASILSWTVIFQRGYILRQANRALRKFEEVFWSGVDMSKLYADLSERRQSVTGLEAIFQAGFKEFLRLRQQPNTSPTVVMEGAERGMRIATAREVDQLELHLPFLATVGSVSPYVGLFGTVWGIMTSFRALGAVEQATIAMVAPGISEALIATAIGLFAAIPAVVAYNRYSSHVTRLTNHYETFSEEFANILYRESQHKGAASVATPGQGTDDMMGDLHGQPV